MLLFVVVVLLFIPSFNDYNVLSGCFHVSLNLVTVPTTFYISLTVCQSSLLLFATFEEGSHKPAANRDVRVKSGRLRELA